MRLPRSGKVQDLNQAYIKSAWQDSFEKKLENPASFCNNGGENTSSLFQDKGAFE